MKRLQTAGLTLSLCIATGICLANPDGAEVIHGSATFAQPNANVLNITNSNNTVINWQSFNIGSGQTTNFIQSGANSSVLNRVVSNTPSQIYGNLNSNGKVFLINQHGLMIGAGAQINTAGFFGSTLNITNEDFLNGKLKFEGGGFGGIENYGYIHAGDNGNIVLIAPDIENGGVIEVDDGRVILAAGESITITSLNDASIEFDVQSDGNSIINLGDIIANQGAVNLFAGTLSHSGAINATGLVQNADGSISLVAKQDIEVTETATLNADGDDGGSIIIESQSGDVLFSGSASARGQTRRGGHIEILGERVGLFAAARVDASGLQGGGEVLVGGDFQGGGNTHSATQTQVSADAKIHADAIESGDGGKVIVWADDFTLFHGEATAHGGIESGDGGFIEISGKGNLGYDGSVNASADNGSAGSVLFDPTNVIIQNGGTTVLPNPLSFVTIPGTTLTFNPTAITDITSQGTAVTIQADLDITINNDIISAEGGAGGDITFEAGQSILINANIDTDGGTLKLYANAIGADSINRSGGGTAEITMLDDMVTPITLTAGSGNIELWMNVGVNGNDPAGDITLANLDATHVLIKYNGTTDGGSILQHAGGLITASSVFVDHDGPTNGSVGSAATPLNMLTSNVGAHIHKATTAGIFIDAQPLVSTVVSVGNTCYGAGSVVGGCNSFGPHGITGLETVEGGGDIVFSVVGDINVSDQIRTDDLQATGNPGDIFLKTLAGGAISSNNNIFSNTSSGVIIFDSVAPISLNSGTYRGLISTSGMGNPQINGGVIFDGVGLQASANLTLTAAGNLAFVGNTTFAGLFKISGGTLDLSGITLTLNGGLDWNGGATIQGGGSGVLVAQGASTVSGIGIHSLDNVSVNNNNVFSIASALPDDFRIENGSVFNNNALFDITADVNIFNGGTPASFNNNGGLFVKSGGTGLSTVDASIAFINTAGTIDIQSGALTIASRPTLTLDSGSLLVSDGTFNGNLTLDPGSLLTGNGTIIGNVINNGGSVNPGSLGTAGELTIDGNFTNASGADVVIEILDTVDATAGNEYDLLTVTGQANLDGSLVLLPIDSFVVAEDANIFPVTYTSLIGSFASIFAIGGEMVLAAYGPSELDLFLDFAGTGSGFNWTGGGNGLSWNDNLNWSGLAIPTISDDVTIGTFSVNINADAQANSLSLAAGSSLGLSGGTFTTNELVINGVMTVTAGSTLAVQNGVQSQDLIVNAGGALVVNGGNLNNLGDSRFDGSFTQLAGSSIFSGAAAFNGPFNMNGGSLAVAGAATINGLFTQNSGTTTFRGGTTFPGGFTLNGGRIDFDGSTTLSGNNNLWSGGIIGGTGSLNLGSPFDGSRLVMNSANSKTLDTITLQLNQNELEIFDSGNLVLNNASIDNSFGQTSIHHYGNGDITGVGSINNSGGVFSNLSGDTTIAVDLINDSSSLVNIQSGILELSGPTSGSDTATYNVSSAGLLRVSSDRTFDGTINSAGALHINNAAIATMNMATLTTPNLVLSGSANLTGSANLVVTKGLLWAGTSMLTPASLTTTLGSVMQVTAPAALLPGTSTINGSVLLTGSVLSLNSNTLRLANASSLSGTGIVQGNVVNNSGLLLAGGTDVIGALAIAGSYTQTQGGVMIVKVFNNGFITAADRITVTGPTNLGGTLVIGFVTTSLGLVTANFSPFDFQGGVSGAFNSVIDASGRILFIDVTGGLFTIVGISPKIPDSIVEALINFISKKAKLEEELENNRSKAEEILQALLEEEDEDENGLVCN